MLSDEEKRARNAEKQRRFRARRAQEREAEKAARGSVPAPSVMRSAVGDALAAMKWLVSSDAASVAQARELARQVDELSHVNDYTRALSAHRALSRVLNDLGGTPTVRMQHELRSLKLAKKIEGAEHADGNPTEGATVSQFRRPPKRTS